VKLPDGFDLLAASLLGVASVAYHDARRAKVRSGDKVLVIGAGLIGQFAAQAARLMGADWVAVAGHHDDRLAAAAARGADRVFNSATSAGLTEAEKLSPYSVVLECSGGDVLDWIIGTPGRPGLIGVRSQARLVLVGGRFEVTYDFNMAGRAEVDILHTQHFDQADLVTVVDHAVAGRIQLRPLIRDVVPLAEAPALYQRLRDDPASLLGVVFTYN
jgi:threonine dehydrogenase-like Zn-dependent dehydrogenase